MKPVFYLLAFAMTMSLSQAHAEKVDRDSIVDVRGCSDSLFSDESTMASSAVANYRQDATEKCADKGYTDWVTLENKWSGLFAIPRYCLSGTVQCR